MTQDDVREALAELKDARSQWGKAHEKFNIAAEKVAIRLIHEAVAARMSVEDVARIGGLTPKRVRTLMRQAGLDPRNGKGMLAENAAAALTENAALIGIDPKQMDLTSPLAYLPMGDSLRHEIIHSRTIHTVTDLPEDEH